ncbi:protein lava lamp isoform X2 [Copidosoma floridanum]|uniref:protein lava lamp isoform X2 n=1 Tax=Copidosoma floridanum TaxID=29053 RepID=UPI0006C98F62|nr:protein lava lamp isoform X2 [Copidosoma floridanum]
MWFFYILILQLAMWGSSEEPPGTMEAGPPPPLPESVTNLKETCEQSKNQLESVKDIMLKNKQSLKKKEEELQEYAKKLSKFKTRAKRSHRLTRDDTTSSSESTSKSKSDTTTPDLTQDVVDDISQAKTPIAKSSLLQKKLAEDRKIFEQRSKELTESKRAAEEKVEALRQQFEETYITPVSIVTPVLVTSQTAHPVIELSSVQDKDKKITELSNKLFEMEAAVIDLQENLKEKDSVIDSKTKAITLMSADLSKRGKVTLDTLEDTKDEMRSMQENFVLVEESLRSKNDNLLKQLEEKTSQISALEENVQSLTGRLEAQMQAEIVSVDFSRSTMDTLADTKDAMKSMQENFVLMETSLKDKNENLLKQLEEREIKLAEAEAKILHLESGLGIEKQPEVEDLMYKIEKLERENRNLQDEKYKLQKSISELQNQIVVSEPTNNDALIAEKDSKIVELESLLEELKKSHQGQEEQYKTELQKQIDELNAINVNLSDRIIELEKKVDELETEKGELSTKLSIIESEAPKEDDRVLKLTKELDELNKSMIKLKAQHKNKLKTLQKQLKSFEKVSDSNAELVKLANQITLLEEEKVSAGEWQERIPDLEGKVSAQAKEIESHIEAIAILENQKLDLMQELHAVKQEVSSLEAENAESESLRVTAEIKVVDLEEQLETLQKQSSEDADRAEQQRQLESLREENERLSQKVLKLEELKASSDVGSTESFVKTGSNVDSTESFEALNADADRAELLRKIDTLTRENGVLLEKLTRFEEKGSSDTGSTESFERIPEQGEASSRLDNLTRENYELAMKVTKLEETLAGLKESEVPQLEQEAKAREVRSVDAPGVEGQEAGMGSTTVVEEGANVEELLAKICRLTALNENLTSSLQELEKEKSELVSKLMEKPLEEEEVKKVRDEPTPATKEEKLGVEKDTVAQELHEEEPIIPESTSAVESSLLVDDEKSGGAVDQSVEGTKPSESELAAVATLEAEIARCNAVIHEQKDAIEDLRSKLADKEVELERKSAQIASDSETCDLDVTSLRRELEDSASSIVEWKARCSETEAKLESLEHSKQEIAEGLQALQEDKNNLLEESARKDALVNSLKEELDSTIASFEEKLKVQTDVLESQEELVHNLRKSIETKDQELQAKYAQLQSDLIKMDELQEEMGKLSGKLQQRDTTVASMTEELEALRTNSTLVEEDLFVARHQLFDLQKKLENTKSAEEYEQLAENLNSKQLLVDELEGKIAQRVAEIDALKGQAKALSAENDKLREQLQEEESKAADLLESNRGQEQALQNAERTRADLENRFLELQSLHEEQEWQFRSNSNELRDAYKLMEQLKIKHTEDINMLNRRLEDSLEDIQLKAQEIAGLQSELNQKNSLVAASVSEEVKSGLESQVTDLEKRLAEAEEKSQTQLEKMKKYAAVAKKKTAQVEELESKIRELEEKLTLEKSEKDVKNSELQQSLTQIQEKDNRIVAMEEELERAQTERAEAVRDVEATMSELTETGQKLSALQEELQQLNEVKERARELGVRMEVMEKEYMEQLTQINSLTTENRLLLSKQTQINERLENVEKESEERRAQLEKLEKEKEIEETRKTEAQEICTQCASRVQALEAKLQERDAEIENLDNELHNSIGNLVQMQENLRLSTIPDNSLQESYNELMAQFNSLTAANEETRTKYEAALRENYELSQRVSHLQELNTTMQTKLEEVERELAKDKETAAAFESKHSQYIDLLERFEKQKAELETSQSDLHQALATSEASQRELQGRIEQLEGDKQNLIRDYEQLKQEKLNLLQEVEQLKSTQQNVVVDEGWGLDATSSVFDVEALSQQQQAANETDQRQKRDVEESLNEIPPLFDASVFGAPPAQPASAEQELEIGRLRDEVSALNRQIEERKLEAESAQVHLNSEIQQARETIESLTVELRNLNAARADLESALLVKDAEVSALHNEIKAANDALAAAKVDYEKLSEELEHKNAWIISATNEREGYLGQLEHLNLEKQEAERVVGNLLFGTPGLDESSSLVQKLQSFEIKHGELLSELEAAKNENQELLAAQEVHRVKIVQLEMEAKTSGDSAVIAELESRVAQVVREREILQLQVNDVARAYEDLKESTAALNNVQSQLEAANQEKDQLLREIEVLRASQEIKVEKREAQQVKSAPAPTSESMWEDDEDPWGFNDKSVEPEQHVYIPVVPSTEIQLRLKVDELEEKLKELTDENAKLIEEGKTAQVKNVKYVKKLKEYKVQFDSLQRELKSQRSIGGLGDLDSAIEEEFRAQIASLEKVLVETREENKKLVVEKAQLQTKTQQLADTLNEKKLRLDELSMEIAVKDNELSKQRSELEELRGVGDKVKGLELSIEAYVMEVQEKNEKINEQQAKLNDLEATLNDREQQEIDQLRFDLQSKMSELEEVKGKLEALTQEQSASTPKEVVSVQETAVHEDDVPVFTFGSDTDDDRELKKLKAELKAKNDEIEHLLYSLNEAKTTRMIQELQDNVNALYNEKSYLEEQIIIKNQEIHALKTQLDGRPAQQQQQHERRKRSLGEQEELMRLQNELHSRDQQINDLRYLLAEKEAQLKETLPVAEEAKYKMYENFQEIESYKLTVDELQAEVASLRGLERLAAEDKATIERLNSEKETVRMEAQQDLERILLEKKDEIASIKKQLEEENQRLMSNLGLRERDVENLKQQLLELAQSKDSHIEQQLAMMHNELDQCNRDKKNLEQRLLEVVEYKDNQVEHERARLQKDIWEQDQKIVELNATKEADINNMLVQLSEKNAKIEELVAWSGDQENQLAALKKLLEMREQQINGLMQQLEEKSREYELIHNALQRHVSKPEQSAEVQHLQSESVPVETDRELDLALYMLHQRDVRCEELALELTQLVDERDTLQLRLSNALRVNEELKKYADTSPPKDPSQSSSASKVEAEPLVENPSPSKSKGPVEIAKEAIDSPIGEDKKALAQKLSQLKSIDHGRDVRLKDDREQRHSQQMMLMAHKDVLSKLPPEAAARLVNANYTLSRDVQSQSSVLMNWLWGKSTPKVMHM